MTVVAWSWTVFQLASKVAILDQIRLNWHRKTCRGMSAPFFILGLLSYGSGALDGTTGGGWGLTLGQGSGVILCLAIVAQAWWYDWRR